MFLSFSTTCCSVNGTLTSNENGILLGGIAGVNNGIIDLCQSNISIVGGGYIAGITGENRGLVSNCTTTGILEGEISVGGIVGQNEYGTITSCTVDTELVLKGETAIGGICGTNSDNSIIEDCTSTIIPEGLVGAGSIVGFNYGNISECEFFETEIGKNFKK